MCIGDNIYCFTVTLSPTNVSAPENVLRFDLSRAVRGVRTKPTREAAGRRQGFSHQAAAPGAAWPRLLPGGPWAGAERTGTWTAGTHLPVEMPPAILRAHSARKLPRPAPDVPSRSLSAQSAAPSRRPTPAPGLRLTVDHVTSSCLQPSALPDTSARGWVEGALVMDSPATVINRPESVTA